MKWVTTRKACWLVLKQVWDESPSLTLLPYSYVLARWPALWGAWAWPLPREEQCYSGGWTSGPDSCVCTSKLFSCGCKELCITEGWPDGPELMSEVIHKCLGLEGHLPLKQNVLNNANQEMTWGVLTAQQKLIQNANQVGSAPRF